MRLLIQFLMKLFVMRLRVYFDQKLILSLRSVSRMQYTYITQGIPSDYAMNEACSAGTGVFLKGQKKRSILMWKTLRSLLLICSSPNFNDQCSAFISSDIATAFQEGITRADIVAGLVYRFVSIIVTCARFSSFWQKIFMQGGVCYNKAVLCHGALLNTPLLCLQSLGSWGFWLCV